MLPDSKTAFAALVLVAFSGPASAADLPGYACTDPGTTKMADGGADIIGCLGVSAADTTPVWKTFTPLLVRSPGDYFQVNGNGLRIGEMSSSSKTFPGYGRFLLFSGGPYSNAWDGDNSDPLWIARYNTAVDYSELRVNIGDNASTSADKFVVGAYSCVDGLWYPRLTVQSTGSVGIGTTEPRDKLSLYGQSDQFIRMETVGPYGNLLKMGSAVSNGRAEGQIQYSDQLLIANKLNDSDTGRVVMKINKDGDVGIGSTEPDFALSIARGSPTSSLSSVGWGKGLSLPPGNALVWKGGAESSDNNVFMAFPSSNPAGHFFMGLIKTLDGKSGPYYVVSLSANESDSTFGSFQFTKNIYAPNVASASDARLKKDVKVIPDALSKVGQLRGVTFNWTDPQQGKGRQAGVLAQDVEKVLPEVVFADDNGMKSVDYGKLTPLLIEAIKEIKASNDALQATVEAQNAELQALKAQMKSR